MIAFVGIFVACFGLCESFVKSVLTAFGVILRLTLNVRRIKKRVAAHGLKSVSVVYICSVCLWVCQRCKYGLLCCLCGVDFCHDFTYLLNGLHRFIGGPVNSIYLCCLFV